MGQPTSISLGWEDVGPGSAFFIFPDSSNPFDLTARRRVPRSRLYAMARLGMTWERCEQCSSRTAVTGQMIDPSGPESPDNYVALCPACSGTWEQSQRESQDTCLDR